MRRAFLLLLILLASGCSAPEAPPSSTTIATPSTPSPPPSTPVPTTVAPPGPSEAPPTTSAPVTFRFAAPPGIDRVDVRFPVFWGPYRDDPLPMARVGDHFEATKEFPLGSLIRYQYSEPFFDNDHREQIAKDREANRMVVVAGPITLEDEAWDFGWNASAPAARLQGRVVDNATGEPVLEPWLAIDGALASAMNGTFDVAVRARGFAITAFTPDGSYHARTLAAKPGEVEIRLDRAASAHVRIEVAASPPPYHEVRLYATAAQVGATIEGANLLSIDTFRTVRGGAIELDLHEGQWVDYLYTVGNTVESYEHRDDGRWVVRGFAAKDGLVVRDVAGPFLGEKATWFNVTVPSYTDPNDVIGISALDPRLLFMHRVNATSWTLAVSHYDTEGRAYRYFKSWPGPGDEQSLTRVAQGAQMIDHVDAWKHQSAPVLHANVTVPPIQHPMKVWAYLPDWYSHLHAFYLERVMDEAAARGFSGVVVNQVQQYERLEPTPYVARTSARWQLYLPADEAIRAARLAHERGLEVMMYTQMGGAEQYLATGHEFNESWWRAWSHEIERLNVQNARVAQAAGIDELVVHAKEPGLVMPDSYLDDYNATMRHVVDAMREVYHGKLVVPYDAFVPGQDYWRAGDVISEGGWSLNLSANASQAEVDAWAAQLLDARYKPEADAAGKPMVMHVAAQSTAGALAGEVVPEERGPFTEQNHEKPLGLEDQRKVYEAFFKAANERPWIDGLFVWVFGFTDLPEARDVDARAKPAEDVATSWARAIEAAT